MNKRKFLKTAGMALILPIFTIKAEKQEKKRHLKNTVADYTLEENLVIEEHCHVGIGGPSPSEVLDVRGDIIPL